MPPSQIRPSVGLPNDSHENDQTVIAASTHPVAFAMTLGAGPCRAWTSADEGTRERARAAMRVSAQTGFRAWSIHPRTRVVLYNSLVG